MQLEEMKLKGLGSVLERAPFTRAKHTVFQSGLFIGGTKVNIPVVVGVGVLYELFVRQGEVRSKVE